MTGDRRASTALGVATILAVVAAILYFQLNADDQREVTVEAGNPLPDLQRIERQDDHGAGTVRAYLQAALACDAAGRDLMLRLSRRGEREVRSAFADICQAAGPPRDATATYRDGSWTFEPEPSGPSFAIEVVRNRDGDWEVAGAVG